MQPQQFPSAFFSPPVCGVGRFFLVGSRQVESEAKTDWAGFSPGATRLQHPLLMGPSTTFLLRLNLEWSGEKKKEKKQPY